MAFAKRIRLITRGDDCGGNHTVNRAILDACQHGILKNVSMMVTCAAIEEAAQMFADERQVCVGLHATLNAEWDNVKWGPISERTKVPSLVDANGYFLPTPKATKEHAVRLDEVFIELQAQLDYARRLGFDIRYVDQHMLFESIHPDLPSRFDAWCKSEGVLSARAFRKSLPNVNALGDPVEQLIANLKAAEPGQYLIVGHPAYDTLEMRALGHEGYSGEAVAVGRNWERLRYTDERIVSFCKEYGVEPIRYDEATPN